MAGEQTTDDASIEIPQGSTVIRQSSWAWQLPASPWVLFMAASFFLDAITIGPFVLFLMAIVVVPRYLRWRKALYILTEDHVVVLRGGLTGRQRFDLPIAEFTDMSTRPGLFGGTLGYRAVDITLRNGNRIVLDYLPKDAPLVAHIQSRIGRYDTGEQGPSDDGQTEGESGGDDDHDESVGGRDR